MASRFVKSVIRVRDIDKQPLYTTNVNDILSDMDGNVYIRTTNGFEALTGQTDDVEEDVSKVKSDLEKATERVKSLEDENGTLKEDLKNTTSKVETLETDLSNEKTKVATLESDYQEILDRVKALEDIEDNSEGEE